MIWKKKIFESEFNRNVIKLFFGTTVAQAIPVAIAPILTRLYSPEEFGLFALFFSISNVLGIISCARYEMAIVLPKDESDAAHLETLCYLISFGFGLFLLIITLIFQSTFLNWLGNEIGYWIFFIPLSVFFTGIIQATTYRLNRNKNFGKISTLKIIQTSATGLSNISMGISSWVKNGLIIGHVIGQLLSIFFIGVLHPKRSKVEWKKVKKLASQYKNFLIYNAPASLLNTAASNLPIFYLTKTMEKANVGFYGLVERSIAGPMSLLSYSISQVLLEDIASRFRNKLPIHRSVLTLVRNLFLIGIMPFSMLFLLAPTIFSFVFGSEWIEAGEYASILSIGFFAKFIISPLSVIFISTNNTKKLVAWQVLYFCTTIAVVIFSNNMPGVKTFLIALTINDVVLYSFYLYLILRIAKK